MGKILASKKRAFLNFEVCPVKVEYPKKITMKVVLKKCEEFPGLLQYLPDDYAKHVSKDYLFTLVNTWDPSFFPTIVEEVSKKLALKNPAKPQFVELSKDMMDLL